MFYFFISMLFLLPVDDNKLQHPVHVSLTNIEYKKANKNFELVFKIFTDDFENALKNKYGVTTHLGTEKEVKQTNEYIKKYILENFRFLINNRDQTSQRLKFLRKDFNTEATWLYYEFIPPTNIKSVTIKNTILNQLFNDQTNLVFFSYLDGQKAYRLDNIVTEKHIEF